MLELPGVPGDSEDGEEALSTRCAATPTQRMATARNPLRRWAIRQEVGALMFWEIGMAPGCWLSAHQVVPTPPTVGTGGPQGPA